MKSPQFCSVCKQWLEMEVVPTSDGGEDDGVIWFRCPQCQGFLPKLSGADLSDGTVVAPDDKQDGAPAPPDAGAAAADENMPWDSPADMMAAQKAAAETDGPTESPFLPEDDEANLEKSAAEAEALPAAPDAGGKDKSAVAEPAEPIAEYAAMLAASDVAASAPYRPWETYEIGQCIHHLAWDDCGVVVAKEDLRGGRKIIKCYFGEAGVVRLIEQEPR
jgi:hypothetical protein